MTLIGKREFTTVLEKQYGGMRYCKHCGRSFSPSLFARDNTGRGGLSTRCVLCNSKRSGAYVDADKRREFMTKYLAKPEVRKRHNERNMEYYERTKDERADYRKKYRQENRKAMRAWNAARRQEVRQRTFPSEKDAIVAFYRNCPDGYHVDHIVPINHPLVSGLHVIANLQYLPARDNLRKQNRFEV